MLKAETKRAWLTVWSETARAAGRPLRAKIIFSLMALPGFNTGGQLISQTSAFGHSVTFSVPGTGTASPGDLAVFAAEALQEHDLAVKSLENIPADRDLLVNPVSDSEIVSELLFRFQPCREATSSYLGLQV